MAKRPAVARRRERIALRAAILVVTTALAYWPALPSPFLFDDQPAIVDNPQIRAPQLSVVLFPPNDTPVAGRPLVNASFALSYGAGDGLNPRVFRLANLGIHILAGLVLFGVVRRTLQLPAIAARFGEPAASDRHRRPGATDVAFAVALLWTLHPLNSEVVNYIVERTESMMGLFYLLTIYCALRGWTIAAIAACAAGMLCKESMVTAPVMVVLIDRLLVFTSWRAAFTARRALYGGLAATWLVLIAIMASTPRSSVGFATGVTAWTYLLNQAQMITRYLELAAWPRALVLDYGLPRPLTLSDALLPGLIVVALIAVTIAAVVRRPALGLLGAWFFITLAPTSSFVPIATEVGAERRMYLPLIAIVVLVVLAARTLVQRVPRSGPALLTMVCALMVAGIILRGREYASPVTMAQTIVDRWPNGRGHFLLGSALVDVGRTDEGMAQFRESARDYPGALFAIGTEQLAAGQIREAIDTLQRFLREIPPNHPTVVPARDMIGRAYAAQGNLAAAEDQARQIVRLAPGYVSGQDLLARVLAGQARYAEAAVEFQRLVAIDPGNAEARRALEIAQRLAAAGR